MCTLHPYLLVLILETCRVLGDREGIASHNLSYLATRLIVSTRERTERKTILNEDDETTFRQLLDLSTNAIINESGHRKAITAFMKRNLSLQQAIGWI